jgi:hypothetical protein
MIKNTALTCQLGPSPQNIAEPLHYRSLDFTFFPLMSTAEVDAQIPALDDDPAMCSKIARWTRSIYMRGHCRPELVRILRHAANLRVMLAADMLLPEVFEVLANTAGGTLTDLDTLTCAHPEDLPSWTHMCRLWNLRTLDLTITRANPNGTQDLKNIPEMPALALPLLELLIWTYGDDSEGDEDDLKYWLDLLARCHFPGLKRVSLNFDEIPTDHLQPVITFIRAHVGVRTVRLEQDLLDLPNLRAILPFVRARGLRMDEPPDSPEFLDFLSPDVHELVIGLDTAESWQRSYLGNILASIADKPMGQLGLRRIEVARLYGLPSKETAPFLWTFGGDLSSSNDDRDAYGLAMNRLRAHAFRLRQWG